MAILPCAASHVRIAIVGLVASAIASSSVASALPQTTTSRISVDSSGNQGFGLGVVERTPHSRDGRYVVFTSAFTTLVPGDTNGWPDVFVRDTQLATTTHTHAKAGATNRV